LDGAPVFFAAARDRAAGLDRRDLRVIAATIDQLLTEAAAAGYHTVYSQVLAAGRLRATPAVFNLIEMIRGFGRWAREHRDIGMRLSIRVVAPDVLFALDTSRIDISAILLSEEIRFWVNVEERQQQQGVERRVRSLPPDAQIKSLVDELDVPAAGGNCSSAPPPTAPTRRCPSTPPSSGS
jgi:hypothetical protein